MQLVDKTKKNVICYTSYNRLEFTQESLTKLVEVTSNLSQIIVIENGSRKDTVDWLKEFEKNNNITVFYSPENLGIAGAMNFVLRELGEHQYFTKYDNDFVMLEKDWDSWMINCMENHPDIWMLGAKFHKDLALEDHPYELHRCTKMKVWDNNEIEIVREVIGNCTMISPECFQQLGFYVEFSKWGYEDADYCKRIDIAGFKQAFAPHLKCTRVFKEEIDYRVDKDKIQLLHAEEFFDRFNGYKDGKYDLFVPYNKKDSSSEDIYYC